MNIKLKWNIMLKKMDKYKEEGNDKKYKEHKNEYDKHHEFVYKNAEGLRPNQNLKAKDIFPFKVSNEITVDFVEKLAEKAKDAEDYLDKIRSLKNIPENVQKEFTEKHCKDKDGKRLSPSQIAQNMYEKFGKKKDSKENEIKEENSKKDNSEELKEVLKDAEEKIK